MKKYQEKNKEKKKEHYDKNEKQKGECGSNQFRNPSEEKTEYGVNHFRNFLMTKRKPKIYYKRLKVK